MSNSTADRVVILAGQIDACRSPRLVASFSAQLLRELRQQDGRPACGRFHATYSGYMRHKATGDAPCSECRAAAREYWRNKARVRNGTPPPVGVRCVVCAAPVPQTEGPGRYRLFCGDACRRESDNRRKAPAERRLVCTSCGKTWTRQATRGQPPAYCSPACRVDANRSRKSGVAVSRPHIFERDGWFCRLCDEPVDPELTFPHPRSATLDHIVPVSLGGAHEPSNVQLAHLGCNAAKGNRIA